MQDLINEREKILEFTHSKFIREGFYRTSMDELARDMQISKKTIYKYFPSKENLLEAVFDMRTEKVQRILNGLVDSNEDCVTKFVKILTTIKKNALNCSETWFRDIRMHAPHLQKKLEDLRAKKIYQIMAKLIEQGKREKHIENIPPLVLITAFVGAIEGVTNADFIMNSKFTMQDVMKITSEIFLNGFLTPLGREKYSNTKKILENVLP